MKAYSYKTGAIGVVVWCGACMGCGIMSNEDKKDNFKWVRV